MCNFGSGAAVLHANHNSQHCISMVWQCYISNITRVMNSTFICTLLAVLVVSESKSVAELPLCAVSVVAVCSFVGIDSFATCDCRRVYFPTKDQIATTLTAHHGSAAMDFFVKRPAQQAKPLVSTKLLRCCVLTLRTNRMHPSTQCPFAHNWPKSV